MAKPDEIFNTGNLDDILKKVNAWDLSQGRNLVGNSLLSAPAQTQPADISFDNESYDDWIDNILNPPELPSIAGIDTTQLEPVLQRTVPGISVDQFNDVLQNDFPAFKNYIQQGGINPDKDQLLKAIGYSDDDIAQLFPQPQLTPEQRVQQFDISQGRTPIVGTPARKAPETLEEWGASLADIIRGSMEGTKNLPAADKTMGGAFTAATGAQPVADINNADIQGLVSKLQEAGKTFWNPEGAEDAYQENWGTLPPENTPLRAMLPFFNSTAGQFLSFPAGKPGSGDDLLEAALMSPVMAPFASGGVGKLAFSEAGLRQAGKTVGQAGREIAPVARRLAVDEAGAIGKGAKEAIGEIKGPPPPKPPPAATVGKPPPEPEFAANIRLEKYPEDVRPLIKEWADANDDLVQQARRGVRSDAQVLEDAKRLVEEVGGDFGKLQKKWKPGQAWNAEEILALRGTLNTKTQAVLAAKKEAQSGSIEGLLKLQISMKEQAAVQEAIHGVTAEAGRALRQFRQEAFDAFKANDVQKMEEILKRIGGREKTEEILKALSAIDINDPDAVAAFIRNINKPKLADYITEIYYNSILSGPKTHIVNSLSNTINAIASPAERFVSAAVEAPLSKAQGRTAQRFFSEVPADAFGAIEGIKDGLSAWAYTMRHGRTLQQASKYEMGKAFKGKLGYAINFPSTNLEAADAMMRQINYRAALKATAMRQVKAKGLKGQAALDAMADMLENPSKGLLDAADKQAEYRLFRTEPGKFAAGIMGLRDTVSIGGFKPFRFIIPFIRTPANLLKYGMERSPLGWLNPKLWDNVIKKNPEAADQIARATLGTVTAASIAWYVQEGRITGAAPVNRAERDRFYRDGKQPYSIRVGDNWISYQRLEPFNQTFAQVAAAVDALKHKEKDAVQKAGDAVSTIMENLVSQTYMRGISDAVDVVRQPERYAGNAISRFAAALMVPASSATRTAAQITDPTVREPGTFAESLKAGIPGLSKTVPPKLDVLGQEVERKSPALSPIVISPVQETALTKELDRLKINIGFAGKTIGGVELSPEEQRQYQVESGNLIKQRISTLIDSPDYAKLSDKEKERRINQQIFRARQQAQHSFTGEVNQNDTYSEYQKLDKMAQQLFLLDNPEFAAWAEKEKGVKKPILPRDFLEEGLEYEPHEKAYQEIKGATSGVTTKLREQYLKDPESAAYAMWRTKREGLELGVPQEQIKDFVLWKGAEDKLEKEIYLKEHPEFYDTAKELGLIDKDIDFDKTPTRKVKAWYDKYKTIAAEPGKDWERLKSRFENPEGDLWLRTAYPNTAPLSDKDVYVIENLTPALEAKMKEYDSLPLGKARLDWRRNNPDANEFLMNTKGLSPLAEEKPSAPEKPKPTEKPKATSVPEKPKPHPLYAEYLKLPLGKTRTEFRRNHPELEKWGVENKRWAPLSTRIKAPRIPKPLKPPKVSGGSSGQKATRVTNTKPRRVSGNIRRKLGGML